MGISFFLVVGASEGNLGVGVVKTSVDFGIEVKITSGVEVGINSVIVVGVKNFWGVGKGGIVGGRGMLIVGSLNCGRGGVGIKILGISILIWRANGVFTCDI